ncbi:hypothetical protein [Streptomyces sp. NPDC015131]|uniref:hypothetical protein n=1 Tax=Streptomyces sp. NPDC015131 TaxID=3364941 RepID=UPI003701B35A
MIPRSLVSKSAGIALDLATGLARDPNDGPGKAVFFSDVTLWLDKQGKDWADFGADYEAVIDELIKAPVPQLYMTLVRVSPGKVEAARTPVGSWKRDQLAVWGVPWPPPKGWKDELAERWKGARPAGPPAPPPTPAPADFAQDTLDFG